MNNKKRYTITSALPYANGPLHLGHISGAFLSADIFARYMRMKGNDVLYVSGSDEHGAAITIQAKKEGISPKDIVDKYHAMNKKTLAQFGISCDIFHRTSEPIHHETAQEFFTQLLDNNEFEVITSEQYYDEKNDQFLADRYIKGTCPKCNFDNAYGDQCEKCGSTLSPTELINPQSTLSGEKPILKETSHWFLPMNKHEEWLNEWIEKGILDGEQHHDASAWKKHVIGQCKSWIDGGLMPRAMTRDLDWGVKVPLKDAEGKVLYVWLDAPIGYISATKDWATQNGKNWEDYWKKENDSELVHFIGKDNIVFHCIIFPIILKAMGEYVLPTNVPANQFLNLEGDKFSTSRNWAVWAHEFADNFPELIDVMRYTLISSMPENKDSDFTWKDFQDKNNNELVAILGNFVNRVVVLTKKYFEGTLEGDVSKNVLQNAIETANTEVDTFIKVHQYRNALSAAMNLAREGNKYLADTEPWKLIKTDEAQVKEILFNALLICKSLTTVLEPFMPTVSDKLSQLIGEKEGEQTSFTVSTESVLLFGKIEDKWVEERISELGSKESEMTYESVKETIEFDDFTTMDLRVAEITSAQKVKKAKKLLQIEVDLGFETRTVVSGIAEHFSPEEVVGKKVTMLINLAPRKIRGVESNGMILMGEDNEGKLNFINPAADLPNGSVIR